jgi:hypothetical protein
VRRQLAGEDLAKDAVVAGGHRFAAYAMRLRAKATASARVETSPV